MNTPTIEERKQALFARARTPQLIGSLRILGAKKNLSGDERLTVAWIREELGRRHPHAEQALEEAFDAASAQEERTGQYVHVDYDAVLLGAIEKGA